MKENSKSQISKLRFQIFNCTLLFLAFMAGSLAFAVAPPPSTDDQLRGSLNSKAGDDYDRELLGESVKPDDKDRVDDEMQRKLQKELGPAAQREDKPKNPLLQVAKEMHEVQPRLSRRDSSDVTQHLQQQIVSDLEKMIKSECSGKSFNSPKPMGNGEKKPGQPSVNPSAPAQKSDPKLRRMPEEIRAEEAKKAVERMKDLFAELQGHEREHVIERPSEYFLPEYELEIEDYFRRLSENQPELVKP